MIGFLVGGEHRQCQRLAYGYEQQCGLLWGHDGDCVPFTPGDYLPPPLLHPLDALVLTCTPWPRRRCPICHRRVSMWEAEIMHVFRGDCENWDAVRPEVQTEFGPCGCVVRELVA